MNRMLFVIAAAGLLTFAGTASACEVGTKAELDAASQAASRVTPIPPLALNSTAGNAAAAKATKGTAKAAPANAPCGSNCERPPATE
jgi:hypothetical protein